MLFHLLVDSPNVLNHQAWGEAGLEFHLGLPCGRQGSKLVGQSPDFLGMLAGILIQKQSS